MVIVIIFLISLSCASASDTNQSDIVTENDVLGVGTNENFDGSTFSELNMKIGGLEDGDILNLMKNITQDTSSPITITKSITINGNGYAMDAKKVSGIFTIAAKDVTLNNITFINSNEAISWYAADGNVNGCMFINNSGTNGGIIDWLGADGKVNGSTFINNSASYCGGAIYWRGLNGTVEQSHFINNDASNGGAVYFASSNGNINGCEFINNTAKRNGGAIFWNGENGTIRHSTFKNNRATGTAWEYTYDLNMSNGDVILINGILPDISEAEINKLYVLNQSNANDIAHFESWVVEESSTGVKSWKPLDEIDIPISESIISPVDWAIDQYYGGDGGTILWSGDVGLVDNCTFYDSNSARRGGGAYMTGSDYVTYSDCYFENCTSGTNGGGVDWLAGANYGKIYNTVFNHTRAARSAGAIYYGGWYGEMENITIIGTKSNGGSLPQSEDGLVKYAGWDSSHWDTNTTGGDAGAIMYTGSYITVKNVTFTDCVSVGRGGAVFLQDNHNVTFEACVFENNYAQGIANNTWKNYTQERNESNKDLKVNYELTGHGGAIAFDVNAKDCKITDSKFYNNGARRNGGAIYFNQGSTNNNISRCEFTFNRAGYGGAIFVNARDVVIGKSKFSNNSARNGGAIALNSYDETVDGCEFENNNASTSGGAVYIRGDDSLINNSSFINNSASYYGGAIYCEGLNGNVEQSHFINNDVKSSGGAIYWSREGGSINNSTFENNSAKSNGGAVYFASSKGNINDCEFTFNQAGYGGAIYANARYVVIGKSKFSNNNATNGGAIDLNSYDETVDGCEFENNNASSWGGAVYINAEDSLINNSSFINNSAKLGGGICGLGWYNNDINASTFEDNSAPSYNHVYLNDIDSIVENSTFKSSFTIEKIYDCPVTSDITINATFDDGTNLEDYSVVFYNNGEVITEIPYNGSNIYQYRWNNLAAGNYSITVNAKNDKGNIYAVSCDPVEFEVYKYNSTVTIDPISSILYGENLEVNFTIENQTFALYEIKDDKGHTVRMGIVESDNLIIDDLDVGNYTITITNYEDLIYLESNASADFSVNDSRIKTEISLNIETGENTATIIVNVNPNATGLVKIEITNGHNQTFYLELDNGTATLSDLYMEAGDYTVDVTYLGDENYTQSSATDNFTVMDKLVISVPDVVKYFHGPERLIVVVSRSDVPVSNANVEITINGVTYERKTNNNGTASIAINLNSGNYPVEVKVNDSVVNAEVIVLSTIRGMDVSKVYRDGTTYNVIVLDGEGNYLKEGTNVTFNINGIIYESEILYGEGFASLVIDLPADKYIITATNPVTGENTSNNITILKAESDISVESMDICVTDEIIAFLILPANATGNVSVTIGENTTVYDIASSQHMSFDDDVVMFVLNNGLKAGEYNISATYWGNEYYNPSSDNNSFVAYKDHVGVKIDLNEFTMTVTLSENATGNITLVINNETLETPIENATAIFDLSDIPCGDYNATLTYSGDELYDGFEVNTTVSLEDSFEVIVENLTKYYGGSERFAVQVINKKGNPVVNASVEIVINGISYNQTTDENGTASMSINLNSGKYPVVVNFNGTVTNALITILPTVNGSDVVKVFRNATQYYATFLDSNGNYLANGTKVRFNINGVMYDRDVFGDKGLAKLNINLEQGEYIITAINLETNEMTSNKITVLSNIAENSDLTKYYKNASQYVVKLIGEDGKAIAGEIVKFNINGVFYTRTTNETGHAKLNINLAPGDYIITAEYKECKVSNNIKVLSILYADDLTKQYGTPDPFEVKLVDGQGKPYANQKVKFNINGVFYYRTTGSDGIARLNINLMAGEYIITSMYDNGATISNKITISS